MELGHTLVAEMIEDVRAEKAALRFCTEEGLVIGGRELEVAVDLAGVAETQVWLVQCVSDCVTLTASLSKTCCRDGARVGLMVEAAVGQGGGRGLWGKAGIAVVTWTLLAVSWQAKREPSRPRSPL